MPQTKRVQESLFATLWLHHVREPDGTADSSSMTAIIHPKPHVSTCSYHENRRFSTPLFSVFAGDDKTQAWATFCAPRDLTLSSTWLIRKGPRAPSVVHAMLAKDQCRA
jgi:hypothetical protein